MSKDGERIHSFRFKTIITGVFQMGLTAMLGLQVLALKLVAWL